MPNFKQFIKGFEEPEAQPEENRDKIIEKVNQKMMNAGTYGALGDKENYEKSIAEAEELRKGLAPKAEPKPETDYSKPYKTFGGKEYFVTPYTDFAGNKLFDISARKEGGEFDLGSRTGYDFKDEAEARKVIDEWEQYHNPQPKPAPRFKRAKQPRQGSFQQIAKSFDEPEQKQFSKEEIALADKTAEVLSHYAWGQGFKVEKLPNGNYLTNIHLDNPDAEPQEVGPDFMLQEREKLLKSGDERFAELWEEYNK